jgi:hypothetical protein
MKTKLFMLFGMIILANFLFGVKVEAQQTPSSTSSNVQIFIGVVNNTKLAAAGRNFPLLANAVIPEIATDKKLLIVIREPGTAWVAPNTQSIDITNDILAKFKETGVQGGPPGIPSTEQTLAPNKEATEQNSAISDSLKELHKLSSATQVGLTFSQYSDRLIDAKATIDDNLRNLPESPIKAEIATTLLAFQDAHDIWSESIDLQNMTVTYYLQRVQPIYNKYNVTLHRTGAVEDQARMMYARTRATYVDDPLQQIWAVAVQDLAKADALTK